METVSEIRRKKVGHFMISIFGNRLDHWKKRSCFQNGERFKWQLVVKDYCSPLAASGAECFERPDDDKTDSIVSDSDSFKPPPPAKAGQKQDTY